MSLKWKLYNGDGKTPGPGQSVKPGERLTWPRTAGIGAQHVVAMFGATFVFPIIMGLDANLAVMMSGVATIIFLLVVSGRIPSYLGTSAAFVGGVAAIREAGGSSGDVTGSIMIAGVVLLLVGVIVHIAGGHVIQKWLPPAVTGAVVMLIGFNLAPVVAGTYWPQDQWVGFAVMVFVVIASLLLRGLWARISILLALVFGYILSWLLDKMSGPITSALPGQNLQDAAGKACGQEGLYCHATAFAHSRTNFGAVADADWLGLPNFHAPSFHGQFILLTLPAVIALIAENVGHVKAVAEMTDENLDPYMGRAIAADGFATVLASAVGGSPTTTYAENIGVMAATRVYSTAAYYVAALVAILLGFCPKFGALINGIPGGVLGGITVVLYGMIGLLGAKIWKENRVDFSNPINLVPLAAGIIIGVGNVSLEISSEFSLAGIAFGTIVAVLGWHIARVLAPKELRESIMLERDAASKADDSGFGDGTSIAVGRGSRHGKRLE